MAGAGAILVLTAPVLAVVFKIVSLELLLSSIVSFIIVSLLLAFYK